MKSTYHNPQVPIWAANRLKKEPERIVYDASKDITDIDLVMMRYRKLQSEAAERILLKQSLYK